MKPLHVLIIEDLEDDALLIVRELKKGGFDSQYKRVDSREDMLSAIKNRELELILCDYQMPHFNALEALEIYKDNGIDIPFIIISGAVGEEIAVEVMKSGAHDYVMKNKLLRLVPAVKRELAEAIVRKERRRADAELLKLYEELETRVEERTFLFKETNAKLKEEIAQRIVAQEELRKTQSIMDTIFDSIPDCIFLKDASTLEYKFANKVSEHFFGIDHRKVIGKTDYDIFVEQVAQKMRNLDMEVLEKQRSVVLHDEILALPGMNVKLCNIKIIPIPDIEGKPAYILGIIEDVTHSKSTEKELQKSEIRISKIFHSSPIPILIYKMPESKIVDANRKFFDHFGYDHTEVFSPDFKDLLIWCDKYERDSIFEQTLHYGNLQNREVKLRAKDGRELTFLFSSELMKFDDEFLLIFMGIDITERKAADFELVKALDKQTELNRLKSLFVSMISHEFRTPLTTIMLSADLLKRYSDKWDDDEKNKHFSRIQNTILKMTQLMENVLIISRIESGGFIPNPENLDVVAFCQSLAETIEFNANVKERIIIAPNGECGLLKLDENLVGLIVTNLVTNAIKYSPEDTPINMFIDCSDKGVIIKVQDFGIGIPPNDMKHLFQSFYRASNVESVTGYGLGLSIVKKCVDAHNGEITVDSKVGSGTTFTVKLPSGQ